MSEIDRLYRKLDRNVAKLRRLAVDLDCPDIIFTEQFQRVKAIKAQIIAAETEVTITVKGKLALMEGK